MVVALGANESVNGTVRLELGTLSEMITVRGEFTAAAAPVVEPPATQATAADRRGRESAVGDPEPADRAIRRDPRWRLHQGATQDPGRQARYPEIAQAAGVQGIVILEALIEKDGTVGDVRVLRSVALLDQAAIDAVQQWRFTPTLLNGQPVEVLMAVTVNFSGR